MPYDLPEHRFSFPRSRFADMLIAETVRMVEQTGRLDDDAALRDAFHKATGREERLWERARLLGHRLMLDRELARWREVVWFAWLPLVLLAFLAAYGTATAVVGSGRTVNALTAFFALLAMPMLTLTLWGASLLSNGRPGLLGRLSFGNILLYLLARFPGQRNPHALTMAQAAHAVLRRARLLPWAFGVVSHAVWAMAFVLILTALGFAFSFQQYRLTWETTILDAGFFVRFVALTGALPHWLGFPLPDAAVLRDPAASDLDHRAWAWWLIGCTFVYGLVPRLVFFAISWAAWRRGMHRMHLDMADPYYRKLLTRFEEMEKPTVSDPEQRASVENGPATTAGAQIGSARAVVGFELPPELAWPPQALAHAELLERIAGTGSERRALLDKLARLRPHMLLVVCNAASTPDRGTERFLREAAHQTGQAALLLVGFMTGEGAQRWQSWLEQAGLQNVACFTHADPAAAWMDGVHHG
jgi:hypothetical protein